MIIHYKEPIQNMKFYNKINFIILGGSIHSNAKYYKDNVIKPVLEV